MNALRVSTAALFGAALLCVSTASRADQAGAERSFQEGIRLFDAKNYAGAADAFSRAYAEQHEERFLWNLAVAELKLGRDFSALQHLKACKSDPNANQAHLENVDALIEKARSHVGHVVITAPAGTQVEMDGEAIGRSPLSAAVDVDPDVAHVIHGRLAGREAIARISAPGPSTQTVPLDFPPDRAASTASSSPSTTPPMHDETVGRPGSERSAPHSTKPRDITVITVGAAAVGALVVGILYQVASSAKADDASTWRTEIASRTNGDPNNNACVNSMAADCLALSDATSSQRSDANLARGFFIASGALAVGSVATFLLWPKPGADHVTGHAWFAPAADRRGFSLAMGASF